MNEQRKIKSYVIRGGRLNEGRKKALHDLYDTYGLAFENKPLDLTSLIAASDTSGRVIAEIGFGMGDATLSLAVHNPETLFIGIEVFPAGVGNLLRDMHERGIRNIRVIRYDAAEVVERMLPDSSFDGFHIFFPDPWPKKRHHKRRLLNDRFVRLVRAKLKVGGYLYAVTDWEDYAEQILTVCSAVFGAGGRQGYSPAKSWRPVTKYERKGLAAGRVIREIYFTRDT